MTRLLLVVKLAIKGVGANKVRSFLTVLGIVIGIAAVIALLALGEGAQKAVSSSISSLGSNLITLFPGNNFRGSPGATAGTTFTERDYEYLNNPTRFPNIRAVSPLINTSANFDANGESVSVTTRGVAANYPEIQDLKLSHGKFFSQADVEAARNLVVLGPDLIEDLFPGQAVADVIGKPVKIKGLNFKVLGVLETRKGSGFTNVNEEAYLPYTSLSQKVIGNKSITSIYIAVNDLKLIDATVVQIEDRLASFRGKAKEDADFTVFTAEDILTTATQVTGIFTTLLASIAGISLLVGGVGISNIMLVSVSERTKEIGLRKAIGARRSDILLQFLVESATLTFLGGILGITLGILMALGIGAVANIEAQLSIQTIILSSGVAIMIGVIFGMFPAYKAAQLDPIVALRYE